MKLLQWLRQKLCRHEMTHTDWWGGRMVFWECMDCGLKRGDPFEIHLRRIEARLEQLHLQMESARLAQDQEEMRRLLERLFDSVRDYEEWLEAKRRHYGH